MMPAAAIPQPNAQRLEGKVPWWKSVELCPRDFRTIGAALLGSIHGWRRRSIFYYFTHTTAKHFLTTSGASEKYLAIGGNGAERERAAWALAECVGAGRWTSCFWGGDA